MSPSEGVPAHPGLPSPDWSLGHRGCPNNSVALCGPQTGQPPHKAPFLVPVESGGRAALPSLREWSKPKPARFGTAPRAACQGVRLLGQEGEDRGLCREGGTSQAKYSFIFMKPYNPSAWPGPAAGVLSSPCPLPPLQPAFCSSSLTVPSCFHLEKHFCFNLASPDHFLNKWLSTHKAIFHVAQPPAGGRQVPGKTQGRGLDSESLQQRHWGTLHRKRVLARSNRRPRHPHSFFTDKPKSPGALLRATGSLVAQLAAGRRCASSLGSSPPSFSSDLRASHLDQVPRPILPPASYSSPGDPNPLRSGDPHHSRDALGQKTGLPSPPPQQGPAWAQHPPSCRDRLCAQAPSPTWCCRPCFGEPAGICHCSRRGRGRHSGLTAPSSLQPAPAHHGDSVPGCTPKPKFLPPHALHGLTVPRSLPGASRPPPEVPACPPGARPPSPCRTPGPPPPRPAHSTRPPFTAMGTRSNSEHPRAGAPLGGAQWAR